MDVLTGQAGKEIERITFLVHPYCYARSLPRSLVDSCSIPGPDWKAYQDRENLVAPRWYEEIDGMGEKDMLIHHPGYRSEEEMSLAEYGRRRLGSRFLELPARKAPLGATAETLAALAPDIAEAFRARGEHVWHAHDLQLAIFSFNYATDIGLALKERGLRMERERLGFRAMGESFEGCVTFWTTMVPGYLGSPSRVEIPYELSVPDTVFLLSCRHVRRVEMSSDTAVYLFVDPQGMPVVLYKRERVRLSDPSFYARLPLQPDKLLVRTMRGRQVPADASGLVRSAPGCTEVMVSSARCLGGDDEPYDQREAPLFISACKVDPEGELEGHAENFFAAAERAVLFPERE